MRALIGFFLFLSMTACAFTGVLLKDYEASNCLGVLVVAAAILATSRDEK